MSVSGFGTSKTWLNQHLGHIKKSEYWHVETVCTPWGMCTDTLQGRQDRWLSPEAFLRGSVR